MYLKVKFNKRCIDEEEDKLICRGWREQEGKIIKLERRSRGKKIVGREGGGGWVKG